MADPADDKTPAPAPASWYGTTPETEGFVKAKGWTSPDDAVKSYQNLEKLQRTPAARTLVIPDREDDAEGWTQIHARLGRPDAPTGYKLEGYEAAEGQTDLVSGEDGFLAVAHANGLSQRAANALYQWYVQREGGQTEASAERLAVEHTAGLEKMKTTWGQAFEKNIGVARHASRTLGVSEEELSKLEDALGTEWLMTTFHRIGSSLGGEPQLGGTEPTSRGLGVSPAEAQAKLNELLHDPAFYHRYVEGHPGAMAEVQKLTEAIAGTEPVNRGLQARR